MKKKPLIWGGLALSSCLFLSACSEQELLQLFEELSPPEQETPITEPMSATPLPEAPLQITPEPSMAPEPETQQPAEAWSYTDFQRSYERYFLLNSQTLWGGTRNYNVLNGGSISRSNDAGQTWEQQSQDGLANMQQIHFFNANEGWSVGSAENFGVALYLGHTVDGGDSWTQLNEFFLQSKEAAGYSAVNSAIHMMSPIDVNRNYISDGTQIWYSENQGKSWKEIKISDFDYKADGGIFKMHFFASGQGKVVSKQDLYLTEDGGLSWVKKDRPWPAQAAYPQFDRIVLSYFKSAQQGHVVVRWRNAENKPVDILYRSLDGGQSWQQSYVSQAQEPPDPAQPELRFNSLYFLNENEGWVGGSRDFIAQTQDGGLSWSVQKDTGLNRKITGFYPSLSEAKLLAATDSAGYWSLSLN